MKLYFLLALLPFVAGDYLRNHRELGKEKGVVCDDVTEILDDAGKVERTICSPGCRKHQNEARHPNKCIPNNPPKKDPQCNPFEVECRDPEACCSGLYCNPDVDLDPNCNENCGTISYCAPCIAPGESCDADRECCDDLVCDAGNTNTCCIDVGDVCEANEECCLGLVCDAGTCCIDVGDVCEEDDECCGGLVCNDANECVDPTL